MKKKIKCFIAALFTFTLMFSTTATSALAAPVQFYAPNQIEEIEVFSFSNTDFLIAAQQAYEEGKISKQEYDIVFSRLSARLGIKGENKIVQVGTNTYDYYLNSLLWDLIVTLGGGAVGAIIGMIPGIGSGVAAFLGALGSGVIGSVAGAEKGVIIRVKMIDKNAGFGVPDYMYQFISIREQ